MATDANLEVLKLGMKAALLFSFSVARCNLLRTWYVEQNKEYHKYAQLASSPKFLLANAMALAAVVPPGTNSFVNAAMVSTLCQTLVSMGGPSLLHAYYKLSPARRAVMRQSHMKESWLDVLLKFLIFAAVVSSTVIETSVPVWLAFSDVKPTETKPIAIFGAAGIGAYGLHLLIFHLFFRNRSTQTKKVDKKTSPSGNPVVNHVEVRTPRENKDASALHENISKKGQNSYYYAHASTRTEELNRGEPPKLLTRSEEVISPRNNLKSVKSYYFVDQKKEVKVYIKDKIYFDLEYDLKWTKSSIRVVFGSQYVFHIAELYKNIQNAEIKTLENKIIIILEKEERNKTWTALSATKSS